MLAIATDFVASTGCPEPALRRIAEAGFERVHWVHHWRTDFLYTRPELDAIGAWLGEFHLGINDIHASAGVEKNWASHREYERLAGVELVANRIEMAQRFDCDVIVMHAPDRPTDVAQHPAWWDHFRRSLDALEPRSRAAGVRIALENMGVDNFDALEQAFSSYAPSYIGLCYDPGHGNLARNGLDRLERVSHRLIATHLNDNDGTADQHRPIFSATVDWPRLAAIIARSGYAKPCMTMELLLNGSGFTDEAAFLAHARTTGQRFVEMVEAARRAMTTSKA